ncbi:hypothetical protein JTB14_012948 [Gonioctena quinquepunctata]|nr:hypothetical protein JTB14_012948 [Gonioctena quinquepunctata]
MSKREREFKRKRQEEQEAAAYVFQDFIETFQAPALAVGNKTFVRSGLLYSDKQDENAGQIYKPKPVIKQEKIDVNSTAIECARILKDNVIEKPKKQEKPKSNLDLLKEELKLRHSDCAERERLKEEADLPAPALSYFEGGDPNSTNLFVANLRSNITENHLMTEFGAYGPLASVKIMWPRGEDKLRSSICGFVAFMSRKDAERALKANRSREDMRVGWGKSVEIPSHPIYIPNELLKHYLPPPQTGLPFNAQPPDLDRTPPTNEKEFEDYLSECTVKVAIPLNKKVLMLVHRMVEFVVREGPMFEAFIMNKELRNPDYNFLFDCQSAVHVYYRWKIFSISNGDCKKKWSMERFRMFRGGSVWLPPNAINYADGMPEELIREQSPAEARLSDTQCCRLVGLIRSLSTHRSKIAEAMVFCLNHKAAIGDSVEIIMESLSNAGTSPVKKIARLYLLSDILHNCKSKRMKAPNLEGNQSALLEVFRSLGDTYELLKCPADKDNFKSRISLVLRHWDMYKLMPEEFFKKVEKFFPTVKANDFLDDDNSSIDEPLDGANLLKRSLVGDMGPEVVTLDDPSWVKGQKSEEKNIMEYFVPSKWDAVDPEEVEAQAMSTEKLYIMELENFSAEEFVERLLTEGCDTPCDETSKYFSTSTDIPHFYNETLFREGQDFFYKHIFGLFLSKLLGLMALLSLPSVKVLVLTNKSSTPMTAYRRYMATIFHMCTWYDSDLKPGSRLWASLIKVRKMHNSASNRSESCLKSRINQMDMACTQFGFMGLGLIRSEMVGIHGETQERWKAFIHLWRVVGHILGIEERFNICRASVQETKEICNLLVHRVFIPSTANACPEFETMSKALIDGMQVMNPIIRHDAFLHYLHMMLEDTKNPNFSDELPPLNEQAKARLALIINVVWAMQYCIVRVLLKYCQILTLWLMRVCPFLAYSRFGVENSHVKI